VTDDAISSAVIACLKSKVRTPSILSLAALLREFTVSCFVDRLEVELAGHRSISAAGHIRAGLGLADVASSAIAEGAKFLHAKSICEQQRPRA
jgi:hypothetical protein